MQTYAGKKIVVSGGSSGIGLAIAGLLAEGGADVLIAGRSADPLKEAQDRYGVRTVRGDIAVADDRTQLASRVRDELGTLDALFVTAGIPGGATFEEMTEQEYDTVFAVNAKGPYFLVQALAPLFSPGAGVVLTTSVANENGMPAMSVYSATKAALRSMTRTLARELLPRGVRVNALSPGPIDTGILHRALPVEVADSLIAGFVDTNPMHRMGEPAEAARAAIFLALDATFTTGEELAVDGGASQL